MPNWLENAWFRLTTSDRAIAHIALKEALDALQASAQETLPRSPAQPASRRETRTTGLPTTPGTDTAITRNPSTSRRNSAHVPMPVLHRYSGKEAIEVRDQTFFRALCAGACLAALADGIVHPSELEILTRAVRNVMEISGYAESEALAYFQVCVDALCTNPSNRSALLSSIQAIQGRIWQARRLMRVCLDLCQSDNEFLESERAELKDICETLSLNPRNYGLHKAA